MVGFRVSVAHTLMRRYELSTIKSLESILFVARQAELGDYEFLFELKKAAEYEPINTVFGWDECV